MILVAGPMEALDLTLMRKRSYSRHDFCSADYEAGSKGDKQPEAKDAGRYLNFAQAGIAEDITWSRQTSVPNERTVSPQVSCSSLTSSYVPRLGLNPNYTSAGEDASTGDELSLGPETRSPGAEEKPLFPPYGKKNPDVPFPKTLRPLSGVSAGFDTPRSSLFPETAERESKEERGRLFDRAERDTNCLEKTSTLLSSGLRTQNMNGNESRLIKKRRFQERLSTRYDDKNISLHKPVELDTSSHDAMHFQGFDVLSSDVEIRRQAVKIADDIYHKTLKSLYNSFRRNQTNLRQINDLRFSGPFKTQFDEILDGFVQCTVALFTRADAKGYENSTQYRLGPEKSTTSLDRNIENGVPNTKQTKSSSSDINCRYFVNSEVSSTEEIPRHDVQDLATESRPDIQRGTLQEERVEHIQEMPSGQTPVQDTDVKSSYINNASDANPVPNTVQCQGGDEVHSNDGQVEISPRAKDSVPLSSNLANDAKTTGSDPAKIEMTPASTPWDNTTNKKEEHSQTGLLTPDDKEPERPEMGVDGGEIDVDHPSPQEIDEMTTAAGGEDEDGEEMECHFKVPADDDDVQTTEQGVGVTLLRTKIWREFHGANTEMIINRAGRRMFPYVTIQLSGLHARAVYTVEMELVPADNRRYKFVNDAWTAVGVADSPIINRPYIHPDSPLSGESWMSRHIHFSRVKLTNNRESSEGNIQLHSMHKYVARINVKPVVGYYGQESIPRALHFCLDLTAFIAVTAYQNHMVTKLKIHNNPFAKAFRDPSFSQANRRSASKRKHSGLREDVKTGEPEGSSRQGFQDDGPGSDDATSVPGNYAFYTPPPLGVSSSLMRATPYFPLTQPGRYVTEELAIPPPPMLMMGAPWMGLGHRMLNNYLYDLPSHKPAVTSARGGLCGDSG